jgi:RecA/RadA recombinase
VKFTITYGVPMLNQLIVKSKVPFGITHIAGPPNSGKTTLIYQICKGIAKGEKALIFDCEMNFSAQRLQEILLDSNIKLEDIIIITIANRKQQLQYFMKMHNFTQNKQYSFIAINGVTDHFRFSEKSKKDVVLYRILALQMAYLKMFSGESKLPIVLTNQVSMFKEEEAQRIRPIANSVIDHYSDRTVIFQHVNKRLWKADYDGEKLYYTLTSYGIEEVKAIG